MGRDNVPVISRLLSLFLETSYTIKHDPQKYTSFFPKIYDLLSNLLHCKKGEIPTSANISYVSKK
jgi:hypothetical protein